MYNKRSLCIGKLSHFFFSFPSGFSETQSVQFSVSSHIPMITEYWLYLALDNITGPRFPCVACGRFAQMRRLKYALVRKGGERWPNDGLAITLMNLMTLEVSRELLALDQCVYLNQITNLIQPNPLVHAKQSERKRNKRRRRKLLAHLAQSQELSKNTMLAFNACPCAPPEYKRVALPPEILIICYFPMTAPTTPSSPPPDSPPNR